MDDLLRDAWIQYVGRKISGRAGFADLQGIDDQVMLLERPSLTPQQLGRTMAIHDGAYICNWHQAKFDKRKNAICQRCLGPTA